MFEGTMNASEKVMTTRPILSIDLIYMNGSVKFLLRDFCRLSFRLPVKLKLNIGVFLLAGLISNLKVF